MQVCEGRKHGDGDGSCSKAREYFDASATPGAHVHGLPMVKIRFASHAGGHHSEKRGAFQGGWGTRVINHQSTFGFEKRGISSLICVG